MVRFPWTAALAVATVAAALTTAGGAGAPLAAVSTTGPLSVLWVYDTKPESYYTVALGNGLVVAGTDGMNQCRTDILDAASGKLQVRGLLHPPSPRAPVFILCG